MSATSTRTRRSACCGCSDRDLKSDELQKKVRLTTAIADVLAARPARGARHPQRAGVRRRGRRRDVAHHRAGRRPTTSSARASMRSAAEAVIDAYPVWVQQKFLSRRRPGGARDDRHSAGASAISRRSISRSCSPEDVTLYQLLQGRIAEAAGARPSEALDTYGQVIAADVRPTRAEAVYRTLLILRADRPDRPRQGHRHAGGRGHAVARQRARSRHGEAAGRALFRAQATTGSASRRAQAAAQHSPESQPIDRADRRRPQAQFADLFLNGAADQLGDLDALSLYYDFRQLTPAGAKGDEMIRNLARRLVKVDLLGAGGGPAAVPDRQPAEGRGAGAGGDRPGADPHRRPQPRRRRCACSTRRARPICRRRSSAQRRILEARALIDADREDLALDLSGADRRGATPICCASTATGRPRTTPRRPT